jgi:hypothetical protein
MKHRPSLPLRQTLAASLVLAPLMLGGCAVGPDYREQISNLKSFHSADAVASRTAKDPAPKLDSWWEGFDDWTACHEWSGCYVSCCNARATWQL